MPRSGRGKFDDENADTDTDWRRRKIKVPAEEEKPATPTPAYKPPPAPWASKKLDAPTVADAEDFPSLGGEAPPPQKKSNDEKPKETKSSSSPWASVSTAPSVAADETYWPSLAGDAPPRPTPSVAKPEVTPVEEAPQKRFSLKPKPQKNFSIFDVVKAPAKKKLAAPPAPSPPPPVEPPPPSPVEPSLFPLDPNAAVGGKPRKKMKLSSLKKRILLERVEHYYIEHPDERPKATIQFLNAARRDELEDDEEKGEILSDLAAMCGSLAPTQSLDLTDENFEDTFAIIEAHFSTPDEARRVADILRHRVVGGQKLRVRVKVGGGQGAKIRLKGVLSPEEIDDPEELEEAMNDLRKLCGETALLSFDRDGNDCVAAYASSRDANRVMASLRSKTIAGAPLDCELVLDDEEGSDEKGVKAIVALLSICSEEILEDEEEIDEVEADIARIAANRGVRGAIRVRVSRSGEDAGDVLFDFGTRSKAEVASEKLAGIVVGGDRVKVEVRRGPSAAEDEGEDQANKRPDDVVESKKTGELLKVPDKYVRARQVPKIRATEFPRAYLRDQPLDSVLDYLVAQLIGKLFEFQERARIKEPHKAKMRRRLVFGLREVKRGIRADNVKMLVVAPNIDQGDSLFEEITEILQNAQEAHVPIVFALGKQKLGAALRKKRVHVSTVGVYSGDGAHEEYRAVLNRLKLITKDPEQAVNPAGPKPKQKKQPPSSQPPPPTAEKKTKKKSAPMMAEAPPFYPAALQRQQQQVSPYLIAAAAQQPYGTQPAQFVVVPPGGGQAPMPSPSMLPQQPMAIAWQYPAMMHPVYPVRPPPAPQRRQQPPRVPQANCQQWPALSTTTSRR